MCHIEDISRLSYSYSLVEIKAFEKLFSPQEIKEAFFSLHRTKRVVPIADLFHELL